MQIEKKLILCSILAITIGIATITPLVFFMSTATAQTTNDVPWFNVEIPSAYYRATSEDEIRTFPEGSVPLVTYRTTHFIGLQYSVNSEAGDLIQGARMEYFRIHVYSDLGSIENKTVYFGANTIDDYNPTNPSEQFYFERENWFNTNTSGGGSFLIRFNGTLAEVLADGGASGTGGGSGSSSFANTTLPENFLNAQNAQTIYIDVSRLGYITFDGNTTIVTLADSSQVIAHADLVKNGDHFLYGEVTADQIEHIWPSSEVPPANRIYPYVHLEYS